MLAVTHMAIAAAATSTIMLTSDATPVVIAAMASLLPDIDTSHSFAGKIFFPISSYLERNHPHRGVTHSLIASVAVAAVAIGLSLLLQIPMQFAQSLIIGYSAGWFADVFTVSGVQAFYPSRAWAVCPGNRAFRLSTGSPVEYMVLAMVTTFALTMFYLNSSGGLGTHFNNFLATSSGVADMYNQHGSDRAVFIHVRGVRAIDRVKVDNDYRLIEPHGEGFIIKDQTGIYKVGADADAQIIPEKITGELKGKITVRVQPVVLDDESIVAKVQQLAANNMGAEIYLTGAIQVDDVEGVPIVEEPGYFPTIAKAGTTVNLASAPYDRVMTLLNEQWGIGQINARIVYITLSGGT